MFSVYIWILIVLVVVSNEHDVMLTLQVWGFVCLSSLWVLELQIYQNLFVLTSPLPEHRGSDLAEKQTSVCIPARKALFCMAAQKCINNEPLTSYRCLLLITQFYFSSLLNSVTLTDVFSARPLCIVCGLGGGGMPPAPLFPLSRCNKCVFNCCKADLSPKWMIMITLHEKSIWRGQPEEKKRVCVHTPMCVHWGGICRYSFTLLSDNINITGL